MTSLRVETEPGPEATPGALPDLRGLRIDVRGLSKSVGDKGVLHDVSFSIAPGELVGIVGGSGAGKSTLLDAIAGLRPADEGTVAYDGQDYYANLDRYRSSLGYVPQDDIIHKDLPLELTLRYAALLRLPAGTPREEVAARVAETMSALGLAERAHVKVGALSGGQRKRASIGVELLTRPRVFFLDEPTSGLDPSTGLQLVRLLRELSHAGSTVVMTTHAPHDIGICDKVLFLTKDGHLAFFGTPEEARRYFDVESFEQIYERLERDATPEQWGERFRQHRDSETTPAPERAAPEREREGEALEAPRSIGSWRQWLLLTRRNVDILVRNPLTLAILIGSPLMVVGMFALLFQPDAFVFSDPSPGATVMIIFWIAFGGFFFGLTYGLLQIVTEFTIVRRERLVNLRLGPYVLSKLAVLLPFLAAVNVLMLLVLRALDRLPRTDWGVYGELAVTLMLDSAAALALGLLASAAVSDASQATIALPMLCFPAVLFSGAILPVPIMATAGRVMSYAMSVRWSFEALGNSLNLNHLFARGGSQLGPPLLAEYDATFSGNPTTDWAILAAFTLAFLALAVWTLDRRCRAGD